MDQLDKLTPQPQRSPAEELGLVLPVLSERVGRRMFMRYAGVTAAAGIVLTSCAEGSLVPAKDAGDHSGAARVGDIIDLGAGDVGILNLAYTLEQIEFAFLTRLRNETFNTNALLPHEKEIYEQFYQQERSHIAFFRKVLGAKRIPDLTINLSSVNFSDRLSVLRTSVALSDTATGAYNGTGPLLASSINLGTAGKLVSVEARHAAIARELLAGNIVAKAFAGDDIIDANGLDPALSIDEILRRAKPFVDETVNAPRNIKSI